MLEGLDRGYLARGGIDLPEDLDIDVSNDDGLAVIKVEGEIDIASSPALGAALDHVDADRHVVLDLGGVDFMDSSGLKVLIGQTVRRGEAGGSLYVRNASSAVRRVVEITGLNQFFFQVGEN
jgi:anti-sigma B factor antagonist